MAVQTIVDVRNTVQNLAAALGVNVVCLGEGYSRSVAYDDRRAGDLELETWSPGDKFGTRYKLYQYRVHEYSLGFELVRDDVYGGYTCGAARFVEKIQFAIKIQERAAAIKPWRGMSAAEIAGEQ